MALKIVKESDPIAVERLTFAIYGVPGLGKTSLAFTADKPLVFDFDHGAYRAANRRDTVAIDAWADVAGVTADDVAGYETIVVDTAGRALDALTTHLVATDPKAAQRNGALSLQGFGALKSGFTAWLKRLHSFGKDVILVCHADEQRSGDDVVQRIDVQGGSKNEIYKAADAMGHLATQHKRRVLIFDPTEAAFGKNPAQMEPLVVPHFGEQPDFLAGVVRRTKDALNAQTAAQKAVLDEIAQWNARCEAATDAEAFNALKSESSQASNAARTQIKRLITQRAKAAGLAFDRESGAFVARETA